MIGRIEIARVKISELHSQPVIMKAEHTPGLSIRRWTDALHLEKSAGTVPRGQNEAILAARRAVGLYLSGTSNLNTTQKDSGRARN